MNNIKLLVASALAQKDKETEQKLTAERDRIVGWAKENFEKINVPPPKSRIQRIIRFVNYDDLLTAIKPQQTKGRDKI